MRTNLPRLYFVAGFLYQMVLQYSICPGSSDPIYVITYYVKWVTSSWTHSSLRDHERLSQKQDGSVWFQS